MIYDLPNQKSARHINSVLVNFSGTYTIKWLDDNTALLIFTDEKMMRGSLYTTEASRLKARECKDDSISLQGQLQSVSGRPRPAGGPAAAPKYVAPVAPWARSAASAGPSPAPASRQLSAWEQAELFDQQNNVPSRSAPAPSPPTVSAPESPTPDIPADWEETFRHAMEEEEEILFHHHH
jgi:hypothetical protein